MKLTFLGTRGNIDPRNRRHRLHSSLLVAYEGREIMIDCGEDWRGEIFEISPRAVFVTHAHPDHAFGLTDGAPCPVYASSQAWRGMSRFPIEDRRTLDPRACVEEAGIRVTFFPVEHSTRAPAGGFRISAGTVTIFYIPDVAHIPDRGTALRGVRVYIGDGATLDRSMVRQRNGALIGHTPMRTQLTWCGEEGVPEAIFTHCGSQIVKGDERTLGARLREFGRERGVEASLAHDGLERILLR